MQNSNNLGFKLIAVSPLNNCAEEFRKNLDVGIIYQFYQQYSIELTPDISSVLKVTFDKSNPVPKDLYKLKNGINVSFSAVIGKNGSGKSALFELLYRFIYFVSTNKIVNETQILRTRLEEMRDELKSQKKNLSILIEIANLDNTAYPNLGSYKLEEPPKDKAEVFVLKLIRKYHFTFNVEMIEDFQEVYRKVAAELNSMIADTNRYIQKEEEKEKLFATKLNVSFIYEINESIFEVNLFEGKFSYHQFDNITGEKNLVSSPSFDLENFFYSISLNYSHHSLNSKTIGNWINKLFFKNDGYRTPLVLNPMRDNGNFDINHEIDLSNERLMSTLLYDYILNNSNRLLNKYTLTKFIFTRKQTSYYSINSKRDFDELPNSSLIKLVYGIDENNSDVPNAETAINYLSQKISKIDNNYDYLINGYESLEDFLVKDSSHITRKIRQTVNYLKKANNKYWTLENENNPIVVCLTPDVLKGYFDSFNLDLSSIKPSELIEYALPGFFKIDFEFSYQQNQTVKLSDMSSGEQQIIFNSNAILYHLYNLQSVFISEKGKEAQRSIERPAYSCVNIILDEMELYYHPEMQLRFVSDLMDVFSKLNNDRIQSINVCILTHSPFILSDIPSQNTLKLEDGRPTKGDSTNSFAANIHDLLKDEFFLKGRSMGEFASMKLDELIQYLYLKSKTIELENDLKLDFYSVNIKTEMTTLLNKYKVEVQNLDEKFKNYPIMDIISLIGEPVLKSKLIEMFNKCNL